MDGGYMGTAFYIDLSREKIRQYQVSPEDRRLYLGGKGLATRLLYDLTPAGLDPYSEDMLIIFSTGPMTGTAAPQSNRFVVTTKSPLTGGIANSTCGGNFATKLKKAGVDFVIVRGKAKKPVYIEITEAGAAIRDASHLWGKGAMETQALLPKQFGKAVIGPAGENLVRFAAVVSEERVAGRTGCGAVMGSKNLKAIIADGQLKVMTAEPDRFKKLQKWMTSFLLTHPMTGEILPRLGTANLVLTTAGHNILPVRNFSRGSDLKAKEISGEEMAARHLKKRSGCTSCPIKCGRVIERNGKADKGPEYETIALLASNLGNFDMKGLFEWSHLCDDLGMDTISTGGVIGFATELTARGLLKSDLSFEKHQGIAQLLDDIAHRRGLGDELAEGVKRLSDKYGGKEFAIHVKGLELPGYDPRGCYGQGLEYATTNRGGCHIQGATMYMEATGPLNIDPLSTRAKPELVVLQQNLSAAISSSVFCMFASYAMIPGIAFRLDPQGLPYQAITKALLNAGPVLGGVLKVKAPVPVTWFEKFLSHTIGRRITMGEFTEIGNRVFNMERLYNLREGLTGRDDTLPPRILNESIFAGVRGGVPLHEMLPRYYQIRGWDERGVPRRSTLRRLNIRTPSTSRA
jgi:aldehyde:ferredoxin oxidoreductase